MTFQSPQFVTDLYRDLRERRLLPVIGVLLAAMVVVPILLSDSPQEQAAAPASTEAVQTKSSSVPATQVVLDQPGLRDYKKRLKGDSPTDPFTPFGGVPAAGPSDAAAAVPGALTPGVSLSGESAPLTVEGRAAAAGPPLSESAGDPTGSGATTPSSGGSTSPRQSPAKYYTYRVKMRAGQLGAGELKVHDSVGPLANLPSKNVPALAFLGVTNDSSFNAKTAVFLVSSAVSSVSGEGHCSFAGSACQLLSLKPGEHEDLVWADGLTYRVQLVKFDLVARNQLPSVGNSDSGDEGSGEDGSGSGESRAAGTGRKPGFYFSF